MKYCLLAALIIMSCNSVKRVNRDEAKQLSVIEDYTNKHPFKNDTVYSYTPGDTVHTITNSMDTIIQVVGDTVQKVITKTVHDKTFIHDTTKVTINDQSMEGALQQMVREKDVNINTRDMQAQELKTDIEKQKNKTMRWSIMFFILLVINSGYIFYKLKFR